MAQFKIGDKVMVKMAPVHPEYVGLVGEVTDVLEFDNLYKVKVGGKELADWATEDCLEKISNV